LFPPEVCPEMEDGSMREIVAGAVVAGLMILVTGCQGKDARVKRLLRGNAGRILVSSGALWWAEPVTGKRELLAGGRKDRWVSYGRGCHLRGRNTILVAAELGPAHTVLRELDLRGRCLEEWEAPWMSLSEIVVSPDERWFAALGYDGRKEVLWVRKIGDPDSGFVLVDRYVHWATLASEGRFLYYTTWSKEKKPQCWRVPWEGGEPELLPWEGQIIGTSGHGAPGILWVGRKSWWGDELWWWRSGDPLGKVTLVSRELRLSGIGVWTGDARAVVCGDAGWQLFGVGPRLHRLHLEFTLLYMVDLTTGEFEELTPPHRCGGVEWIPERFFEEPSPRRVPVIARTGRSPGSGKQASEGGRR